jgi:zinc protease
MKSGLFAMLAILLLAAVAVRSDGPAKPVFPYVATVDTLPNGLTVIVVPMSGTSLVSYYSIVRTGSRDEWEPGHSGFAHFFEHMMFRGTKRFPAGEYDRVVTGMGADANAYTTDDYTAYHLEFASEDLERVVDIEADRFQNLDYAEPAFQTEAGAVYGEYRKNVTSPWMMLAEKLQATAFTAHTYRHTTMGFEADIKAMPTMYGYSRSFFARYYRPENTVILAAGDVTAATLLPLIRRHYGAWQRGYTPPPVPAEPPQRAERSATVSYPGQTLPILAVAWKGRAFDPADTGFVAAVLLGELAFGEAGDLYRTLVLEQQRVQLLDMDMSFSRDPGLWTLTAMPKTPGDIGPVREEIDRAVGRYQAELVDRAKLENVKRRLRYSFLMNLDTPGKVAGGLARMIAMTGGIRSIEPLFAAYDAVTPEAVRDAARRYFTPATRTVVVLTGRAQS